MVPSLGADWGPDLVLRLGVDLGSDLVHRFGAESWPILVPRFRDDLELGLVPRFTVLKKLSFRCPGGGFGLHFVRFVVTLWSLCRVFF